MQAAIISITVNANPIFPSDEHLFVMFILLSFFPFVNTFFKKTFLCLPLTGSKNIRLIKKDYASLFFASVLPPSFDPIFTIQHT